MKSMLRTLLFNVMALYLLTLLLTGVTVSGGITTYIIGGFIFTLLSFIVAPILNLITLPLRLLTFGLFTFVTNAVVLYLLTVFVPNIMISAFTFQGFSYIGFSLPRIAFNPFFAYIVSAFLLSSIVAFATWLVTD